MVQPLPRRGSEHLPPAGFQTIQGAGSWLQPGRDDAGKFSEGAHWCWVSITCIHHACIEPAVPEPYLHRTHHTHTIPAPYPLYLHHTCRPCAVPAVPAVPAAAARRSGAHFPQPVDRIAREELIPAVSFIRWCNTTETFSTISQTKSFILDKNPIKSSVFLHRQIKPRLTGLPRSKKEKKRKGGNAGKMSAGCRGDFFHLLAFPRLLQLRVLLQKAT